MMMASAPALLLPAAAGPASRAPPARPLPARAHLLLAARTPQRPVSVRCAHKTGGNNFAGAPGPCGVVHGPALDAVKRAAVDAFRPLSDNLGHLLSLKNVVDVTDYNVGMPLGVAMACIGCYQLFKTDPWTCLDVVLGYAFYKLSVVSSQVHRRGFCNDSITMIKTAIAFIVMAKDFPKNLNSFFVIRLLVFYLYTLTSCYAVQGWKHRWRHDLIKVSEIVRTEEGRREMAQHLINPGWCITILLLTAVWLIL